MSNELERLLEVQAHDLGLDRLRHRREALPERAELEARRRELALCERATTEIRSRRDEVHAEERRLDDESQALGARAAEVEQRLYSGTVTSPRELQAMQADLEMLQRNRSELEDRELEVMEERETFDSQIETLVASGTALSAEVDRLTAAIAAAEAEIDAEVATQQRARLDGADGMPEPLLRDYESRRARNKGAGAARLVGTTCQACHLSIPSTEAESIHRGRGAVVAYCDNCGAILVP